MSFSIIAGGTYSLWTTADCSQLEPSDGCVSVAAYRALWTGTPSLAFHQEAVLRDPSSPYRWFDLAEALFVAGDTTRAAVCSRHGLALAPNVPPILLRAINFAIFTRSKQEALDAGGRLLELAPESYDDVIYTQFARAGCRFKDIEDGMLAKHPALSRRYLFRLMATGEVAAAASAWRWIQAHDLADKALEHQYQTFETAHRRSGASAPPQ